jgi:ubiquitin-conjugating enzyme E2 Z
MSSNPYENEPGFEDAKSDYDKKNQALYVDKIRHETLRIAIIERLEDYLNIDRGRVPGVTVYNAEEDYQSGNADSPFDPFKDLCKRRFLWYYSSYMASVEQELQKHKDGDRFEKMPFEGPGNAMEGTFQYSSLKQRLEAIHDKLNEEASGWAADGIVAVQKETGIASNLQRQFEQIVENYKKNDAVALDLELVEKNPFVWRLVLFGRPMTNLDGGMLFWFICWRTSGQDFSLTRLPGMFGVLIHLSPKFPDVLPRVKLETPLFHHRVSPAGVLCYDACRKDDMKSHIEAIVEAIEEESPAYDPRTLVNPEAARLFWGTPEDKKLYNRRLRRSVQDNME